MLLNCGVGEASWESLGLQGDPTVNPKGNQSWIFIGRLMLKLKLQYFGHLMRRTDSFEKILMLGKIEGRKRREQQRMRWFNGITSSMDTSLSRLQELVMDRQARHAAVHGITKSWTQLNDWAELNWVTHKLENNNTKEVHSLLWRFLAPHQASQLGVQQRDWESPGNLTLKASRIWLQDFHGTGGNRLHSWRTQTRSCMHQDPGERSSDPTEDWTRPKCWCWRVSCGGVGQQWLATGIRALTAAVLQGAPWNKSSWRSPLTLP